MPLPLRSHAMRTMLSALALCVALSVTFSVALWAPGPARAEDSRAATEAAALAAVARRTDAVNANDIDAFLAAYHPDFRLYEYPDRPLGTGTPRMRDIFGPLFAEGAASVTVHGQMVLEHTVVSQETLTLNGVSEDLISVYTVKDGAIAEVRLIELEG